MSVENIILDNKRVCNNCRSDDIIYRTRGLCKKCYDKLIHHPKSNPKDNPRRIRFKHEVKTIDHEFRIGVCNWCRAVVPFDCEKTNMHHEEYHENDPLMGAIELCVSCHTKTFRSRLGMKYKKKYVR